MTVTIRYDALALLTRYPYFTCILAVHNDQECGVGKEPGKPRNARKGSPPAIAHVLKLEGWYVTGASQLAGYLRLDIEMEKPQFPHLCSTVNEHIVADNPKPDGYKTINIRDLPSHGERVDLRAKRPRLECRQCGKRAAAHAGVDLGKDIHSRHRMTRRLVEYIQDQAATRTFSAVGRDLGIAEPTVRRIFKECAPPPNRDMKIRAPRVLGIDDKHTGEKLLKTVFYDLENSVLLDIYDENTADALKQFVYCLDNPHRIEVVCMDMSGIYRSFCRKYLPWAHIVIDKFHVVMKANMAVDKARIDVRRSIKNDKKQQRHLSKDRELFLIRRKTNPSMVSSRLYWMKKYPVLGAVWDAKEKFYGFYSQKSDEEAIKYYDQWLKSLDKTTEEYFKELQSCMRNHREEILNYFRVAELEKGRPVTNGDLEGFNKKISGILTQAPVYDFRTLRQKLLQAYGPNRKEEVKFRRNGLKEGGPKSRIKPKVSKSRMIIRSDLKPIAQKGKSKTRYNSRQVNMFFLEQAETVPVSKP